MPTKDYVEANNPALFLHLDEHNLIPDYVKASARVTPEELEDLSVVAFADPFNRAYPCHTKAACWQSAAWYAGNAVDQPEVKAGIEKMAYAHGIEEDVQKVFACFDDTLTKAASAEVVEDDPKFALSLDFNGQFGRGFENHYPINSYHEVVRAGNDAAHDFATSSLPVPIMRKVATTIMDAAASYGVPEMEMPTVVCRLGIRRLPDPFAANVLVGMRKDAGVNVDPYRELLSQLESAIVKTASYMDAIALADQTAEQLCMLDEENGVRYNSRMQDPYALLYTGPRVDELEKAAAQVVDIDNVHVPVADLLNLSDDKIDAIFSKRVGSVIKQAKACVSGTPDMEKTANAALCLQALPEEATKVLLATLAEVGW